MQADQALDDDCEPPEAEAVDEIEPPCVYLGDLSVEGFRGVGERRTLPRLVLD